MERFGRELVKIMPLEFVTLLECVIASFEANGPMSEEELYQSLPHFKKASIRTVVAILSDELTGK